LAIKVRDLAKEMKISSSACKSYLKIMNVNVKSNLSIIEDSDALKVKNLYEGELAKIKLSQKKSKKIHQKEKEKKKSLKSLSNSDTKVGKKEHFVRQWNNAGNLDKSQVKYHKSSNTGNKSNTTSTSSEDPYKKKSKRKKVFANNIKSSTSKTKSKKSAKDIAKSIKQVLVGPSKKKKYKKEIKKNDGEKTKISINEYTSISELAKLMDLPSSQIITHLFKMGQMVTINQRLDKDTLEFICEEFDFDVEFEAEFGIQIIEEETQIKTANVPELARPPIVTVMGHVDHGKTSILDYIRNEKIALGESGGITQHIGAYQVNVKGNKITFLDTPGHEAFTAMRARGANVTDIAIIVVAANDSVKPQTIEAIDHAKAAGVEIVIAINKIDLSNADINKTIGDLAKQNLFLEGYGGDVLWIGCSAKTGEGIDELLNTLLLVSEMKELKAKVDSNAVGVVIETKKDQKVGVKTTILIKEGTLCKGDVIVCGPTFGNVRKIENEHGVELKKITPSDVAIVYGLKQVSSAGDVLNKMDNEKLASQIAQERTNIRNKQKSFMTHTNMDNLFKRIKEEHLHKINLVIKADSDGSIEALKDSFEKLSTDEVVIKIIHSAVGGVLESDVSLALASDAIIIGFHVRTDAKANILAISEKVEIKLYSIIYDAINDLKDAMSGMLSPEIVEKVIGTARVKEIFKIKGIGTIAGCAVEKGIIKADSLIKLYRNEIEIFTGNLSSLRHYKEIVKEVKIGSDCGLSIEKFNDIKISDIIEAFTKEERKRKI